jgi:hypothetical protein
VGREAEARGTTTDRNSVDGATLCRMMLEVDFPTAAEGCVDAIGTDAGARVAEINLAVVCWEMDFSGVDREDLEESDCPVGRAIVTYSDRQDLGILGDPSASFASSDASRDDRGAPSALVNVVHEGQEKHHVGPEPAAEISPTPSLVCEGSGHVGTSSAATHQMRDWDSADAC